MQWAIEKGVEIGKSAMETQVRQLAVVLGCCSLVLLGRRRIVTAGRLSWVWGVLVIYPEQIAAGASRLPCQCRS